MIKVILQLDKQNYRSPELYRELYRHYQYNPKSRRSKTQIVIPSDKTSFSKTITPAQWVAKQLQEFGYQRRSLSQRAVLLARALSHFPVYYNGIPAVLKQVVAPCFFKDFPNGIIWFVKQDKIKLTKIWKQEIKLEQELLGFKPSPAIFPGIQSYSGLELGVLTYWGLLLPSTFFYPYMPYVLAGTPDGFFLLFPFCISYEPNDPFDLTSYFNVILGDVYTDDLINSRGFRSPMIPEQDPEHILDSKNFLPYMQWYALIFNRFFNKLFRIKDLKTKLVVGLTINRIAVDTLFINTAESPYLRKVFFFHLLDKYASLIAFSQGFGQDSKEVEIWKMLLQKEFFKDNLDHLLQKIPGLGKWLQGTIAWIYDSWPINLSHRYLAPDMLREYRNSSHGYNIRKVEVLLKDTGLILNELPDLSIGLWHYLLLSKIVDQCQDRLLKFSA